MCQSHHLFYLLSGIRLTCYSIQIIRHLSVTSKSILMQLEIRVMPIHAPRKKYSRIFMIENKVVSWVSAFRLSAVASISSI